MEVSRKASFRTIWNDKDVSKDFTPYLSSVSYSDREEGASDEVTFVFDNSTGIFSEDWYPTEGTTIQLYIGYEDKQVDCGLFQVDEIVLSGLPDVAEIKGLSAGITKALRTRNNKAFEEMTLRQIALYFCNKHGLTLVDTSSMLSQINLERKTQEAKTDLAFLAELAKEYGFLFSVKGNKLVFISYYDLDNAEPVKSIDKTEIGGYSFTDKTFDTFAKGSISVKNTKKNKVIKKEVADILNTEKTDTIIFQGSARNEAQAEAKVKAGLWNKNKMKQTGSLSNITGDPELVAGVNVELTGFGLASGIYHILSSTHTVSGGSSYTMSLDVRKKGDVEKPKRVPKTVKETPTIEDTVSEDMAEDVLE